MLATFTQRLVYTSSLLTNTFFLRATHEPHTLITWTINSQGFYLYLYSVSLLFLFYVYVYLLHDLPSDLRKWSAPLANCFTRRST